MPGPKCSACSHPKRAEAEAAVASGLSVREVAKRFGLPYASFDRHCRKCIQKSIAKAVEAKELSHGIALVDRVERLQTAAQTILDAAMEGRPLIRKDGTPVLKKNGDPYLISDGELALKAIGQARKNLELVARLTGELDPEDNKAGPQLATWAEFEALYMRVSLKAA